MIPGVCQKKGITYRRFRVKLEDGRWGDQYIRLPDPTDPRFAEELARLNAATPERGKPKARSVAALVASYRPILADRKMADATRRDWQYYLGLFETEHGHRMVADLRRSHIFTLRDRMTATPGKANVYLSKLRALLDFACERDWIAVNPATGVKGFEIDEHEPWPAAVLEAALEAADPMLRLAIITGLCSGQRISDVIKMQHGWHDGRMMELRSKKTATDAFVPMHPIWLAEIERMPRRAVTLLYDRFGKPFTGTDRIQERIRRLMHKLGFVDSDGQLLYTYHGLGKNACCYLTELGLDESTISAMVGKTPETVRYYAKRARTLMLAQKGAERVTRGNILPIIGEPAPRRAKNP